MRICRKPNILHQQFINQLAKFWPAKRIFSRWRKKFGTTLSAHCNHYFHLNDPSKMIMPKNLANNNNNRCKQTHHFHNEDLLRNFKKSWKKPQKLLISKNHHLNNCRGGEKQQITTSKTIIVRIEFPNKYWFNLK